MTSPARLEDPHLEDPRLDARDHQTLADWWCAALGQVSEDTWTTGPRASGTDRCRSSTRPAPDR